MLVRNQQLQTTTELALRLVELELNLGRSLPKEMVWGDSLRLRCISYMNRGKLAFNMALLSGGRLLTCHLD